MTCLRLALVLSLAWAAGGAAAITCPPDAVSVGSVCVDKYEASIWSVPNPTTDNAALVAKLKDGTVTLDELQAGGAVQFGAAVLLGCPAPLGTPPYPPNFPLNGNWVSIADPPTPGVYSASIPGVLPSTCLSWFMAEQACRLSDKRLLTNADWQAAAAGTPDPAVDDESTTCNVAGPPIAPTLTGSRSACVSNWGAYDMVGNVAEWVPVATTCPGWGTGFSDDQMCMAGTADDRGPGAIFRGGSWSRPSSPGVFAIRATPPPDHYGDRGGFRCGREPAPASVMLAGSAPGGAVPAPRAAKEIRETFLRFFEERGHARVPSASLIPSDPTLLFTNAGMVPFKRVFTGEESRPYRRATTTQKCMRVSGKHNDLEEVGRSLRHHTFFEMLGNFSFGDYFKQDAIRFAWELVTERFGLDPARLAVTVFREDDEAAAIWEKEIGVPQARIYRLGEADNFWAMGDTGPCGPCSEIYLDRGAVPGVVDDDPSKDSGRFLEFWNLVFMQFDRDAQGRMTPLPKPSVDTGAGLERTAQVLSGVSSNYDTDLFLPILARAQDLSGVRLGADPEKDVSLRVVADHARAVSFLIADGVLPSNEGRGYVLRRILRRAARHGVLLGLERPFLYAVSEVVVDEMGDVFPELSERRAFVTDRVRREEERFLETLGKGLALLEGEIRELRARGGSELPGQVAFRLYDTFGFPLDLTQDILRGQKLRADEAGFRAEMESQRARSREAWKGSGDQGVSEVYGRIATDLATQFVGYETLEHAAEIRALLVGGRVVDDAAAGAEVEVVVGETPFYAESGGQVGDRGVIETPGGYVRVDDTQRPSGDLVVHRGKVESGRVRVGETAKLAVDRAAREATVRNHTGTHLLHAALRAVLGPQAVQKGSLVSPERLRFDFTHDAPLTDQEIERIEDLVNVWIEANEAGTVRHMGYREAIDAGAIAMFTEKYGDRVRVVSYGGVSTELCGGTHAKATGDIGLLQVVSQSSVAAGVRRVEAVTGLGALRFVRERERTLRRVGELLRVPPQQAPERVEKLLEERKEKEREIAELRRARHRGPAADEAPAAPREVAGVRVLVREVEGLDGKELRDLVDDLRGQVKSGVVLVASKGEGRVSLALGVTPDLRDRVKAGELVREIAAVVGGKGGGRPDFAQAGGPLAEKLPEAIERLYALLSGAAA